MNINFDVAKKQLLLSDNGDFLKMYSENNGVLYGGDQRLFSSEAYRDKGCGSIAMANIIAYTLISKSVCFRRPIKFSPDNFTLDSFMALAEDINLFLPPDANGLKWMSVFKKYTGISVKYFPLFISSKNALINRTSAYLAADIPPMLSVYDSRSFPIYEFDGTPGKEHLVKAHYMTVTGIISASCGEHRIFLLLSSWGKKFILDFDEYFLRCRNILPRGCGIGSGIFFPKIRLKG